MAKTIKRLDLLIREVGDPHAQENFWRLRDIIRDIQANGVPGPPGPAGPAGPTGATPTAVPQLTKTFATDSGTLAGHLLRINGDNTVTRITDNSSSTIPNGIFGVGLSKPSILQIDVTFMGIIGGYSGFTAGLPLFVSTSGVPTHTAPVTGMVQQIGFAVSATELFSLMMQPFERA